MKLWRLVVVAAIVAAATVAVASPAAAETTGSIAGKVTSPSGVGLRAVVYVFDASGSSPDATAYTAADGSYVVGALPAATGYSVCFRLSSANPFTEPVGDSPTGYASECFHDVAWVDMDRLRAPSGGSDAPLGDTTKVRVTAGATTTVDQVLVPGAAIAGKVYDQVTGNGLAGATVTVYDPDDRNNTLSVGTGADGKYKVIGLSPATKGYKVCFSAAHVTNGYPYGYGAKCYANVAAWPDQREQPVPPLDATFVPVSSGAVTMNINGRLDPTGLIAGVVTAAPASERLGRLQGVRVDAFRAGTSVDHTYTQADGSYLLIVPALPDYVVCFDGEYATGGPSTTGYAPECRADVPWSGGGLPPGTTPVSVASGKATTANASLATGGVIAGTVVDDKTSAGLYDAWVQLYVNGVRAKGTFSSHDGTFRFNGLGSSAGTYTLCVHANGYTTPTGYFGHASECYEDVPWDGGEVPVGLTAVPVSAGATSTVDVRLTPYVGIRGQVTAAPTGAWLRDIVVSVYDAGFNLKASVVTKRKGRYGVILPSSAEGYIVCFHDVTHHPHYKDECYDNVAWDGATKPSGTTPVPAGNRYAPRINAQLEVDSS